MSQENVDALPVTQEMVVNAIRTMLPEALTAAGVPETDVPANVLEATVNIVRASIVASVPEMLALVPVAALQPHANPAEAVLPQAEGVVPPVPAQAEAVLTVADFTNAGISALATVGFNNPAPTAQAPVSKKVYAVEILSIFSVMVSGAIAGTSLTIPGRTHVSVNTAIIMFCQVFTEGYVDGAYALQCHYNARRNGRRVFYYRFWSHFFGSLLVLGTVFVTIFTLMSRLSARDADGDSKEYRHVQRVVGWLKFVTSLLCVIFTVICAGFQSYRAKRQIDLVQTRIGAEAFLRRLQEVENMPPRGRVDFYEIKRNMGAYKLLPV